MQILKDNTSVTKLLMLAVLVVAGLADSNLAPAAEPVKIGVLSYQATKETEAHWQPIIAALEREAPEYDFVVKAMTFAELETAVAGRQVEFVLTNPSHYLLMGSQSGLSAPLATLMTNLKGKPTTVYGGVIFTRSDQTRINTLKDLKGKRVAFLDEKSLAGYQLQLYELYQAGLRSQNDVRWLKPGMPQDGIVKAVLSGRVDAGFVRSGFLEEMSDNGELDLKQIKILHRQQMQDFPFELSTELYPEWLLCALPNIDTELAQRLTAALYLIHEKYPAAVRLAGIYGFTVSSDYHPVIELLKELRLPPFDQNQKATFYDIWQRYNLHIVLSLLVILLSLLISFRLLFTNRSLKKERNLVKLQQQQLDESATALQKRAREQTCLHTITRTSEDLRKPLSKMLQDVVELLPQGLFHTETAAARIEWEGQTFSTSNYDNPSATMSADIRVDGEKRGRITVAYLDNRPLEDDGPFLAEEHILLDLIARRLEDIFRRRIAEERESSSEEQYRSLFNSAADAIFIHDRDAKILSVNEKACNQYGYEEQELLKLTMMDIDTPEEAVHTLDRIATLDRDGQIAYETTHRDSEGRLIPVDVKATKIFFDGKPCLMSHCRDMSERKRLLEALSASESRFRMMFEQHSAVMLLVEPSSGRIVDANRAAIEFYGHSREKLKAMRIEQISGLPPERVYDDMELAMQRTKTSSMSRHILANKTIRTVEVHSTPITIDDKPLLFSIIHDVTERDDMEVKLRLSEERHRLIADNASDVIWTMTLGGRFTYISPSVQKLLGYSVQEAMQKTITDLLTPASQPQVRETLEKIVNAVKAGSRFGTVRLETEQCRQDGSLIWVEITANGIYQPDGTFVEILGLSHDITERKRVEIELRGTMNRLEAMINALPEIMFRIDRHGVIHEWHHSATDPLYMPSSMYMGKNVTEVLPQNAAKVVLDALAEAVKKGSHRGSTYSLQMPQGVFWYEISIAAMAPSPDLDHQYIVMARDITRRRKSEENLRISEERHRMLADNASDVIWTMNLHRRFTYVSPSVEKLRGYTPEEVLQQPMEEALCPESYAVAMDAFSKSIADMQAGIPIEALRAELEQPCKDGTTVWTEVTITIINDPQGRPKEILGVSRDITERRRYERDLKEAHAKAEAANRAKSEFLANMSHEIRTPLNAVLGLAQLLERGPLSPEQNNMVQRIRTAGNSLLGIINDILDFSKIEAGQMQIDAKPFDLAELLDHQKSLHGMIAHGKRLAFAIEGPARLPGRLIGDSLRLEQVLFNLIGNGIKFTSKGEVRLKVEAKITQRKALLRFSVIDTGVGIEPQVLETLFKPFTQADGSVTRRFGGTGLGLSISKRLVDLMGGTIGAESVPGSGSTFWFEVPFDLASALETGEDSESQPTLSGKQRLPGMHLLVVDDSEINQYLMAKVLSQEGADAVLAGDGHQALQILRTSPRPFDAVLMDVQMPVLDGLSATRAIRDELGLSKLPIIAVTAGVLKEEQQRALDAGVTDFLAKPVDLEEMVELLLRWTKRLKKTDKTKKPAS